VQFGLEEMFGDEARSVRRRVRRLQQPAPQSRMGGFYLFWF
jgi:hypothetical protein